MGLSKTSLTVLVGLAVILSGCASKLKTGEEKGEQPLAPPPVASSDTGAIHGLVTDDALVPLVNVSVGVLELDRQVRSDAGGAFTFNEVPPGTYRLAAQKIGYHEFVKSVEVKAGEIAEVPVKLASAPLPIAYHESKSQAGRVFLSIGYTVDDCQVPVPVVGSCNAAAFLPGLYPSEHSWEVNETADLPLETLVVEVRWQPTSALCRSDFQFDLLAPGIQRNPQTGGVSANDPKRIKAEGTKSPIVLRVDRELLEERGIANSIDGNWATRVFAHRGGATSSNLLDYGCSQDQEFHVWVSEFYGERAPDGFSAIG